MSAQSDLAVDAMNLAQMHNEMKLLCMRINAGGHLGSSDENLIADLRRHSKKFGQEITLEMDTSIAAYVVVPFRLPNPKS